MTVHKPTKTNPEPQAKRRYRKAKPEPQARLPITVARNSRGWYMTSDNSDLNSAIWIHVHRTWFQPGECNLIFCPDKEWGVFQSLLMVHGAEAKLITM